MPRFGPDDAPLDGISATVPSEHHPESTVTLDPPLAPPPQHPVHVAPAAPAPESKFQLLQRRFREEEAAAVRIQVH